MSTPAEYIAAADAAKQPSLKKLHQLIRETLPELKTCMVHGMIGYGPYHYRYQTGREGDTARVALASNKTGYSVYVMAVDRNGKYVAEQAKARLGKANVGKSCIRFKKIEDVNLDALVDVLAQVRTAVPLGGEAMQAKITAKRAASGKGPRSVPQSKRETGARTRAKQR